MADTKTSQATLQQQAAFDEIRIKTMEYLGIQHAPKEKQDEVLVQLGETAMQKILIALLERLDESGQRDYDVLIKREPSPEEMKAFFREHIPDFEAIVKKTVDDLMQQLVSAGNAA